MGPPSGDGPVVFGRFEAAAPNERWVGDALHGPRVGGRKTYLFAFLDDHSRLLTGYRFGFAEDTVRLAAALRPALAARGVPESAYVDNGSAYVDSWLLRACGKLGEPGTGPVRQGRRDCPAGLRRRADGPSLPGGGGDLGTRLGEVHPVPGLPTRPPQDYLHDQRDRILQLPNPQDHQESGGHFPTDDAAIKLIWLAIADIEDKRARQRAAEAGKPRTQSRQTPGRMVEGAGVHGWRQALNELEMFFPGRIPIDVY